MEGLEINGQLCFCVIKYASLQRKLGSWNSYLGEISVTQKILRLSRNEVDFHLGGGWVGNRIRQKWHSQKHLRKGPRWTQASHGSIGQHGQL